MARDVSEIKRLKEKLAEYILNNKNHGKKLAEIDSLISGINVAERAANCNSNEEAMQISEEIIDKLVEIENKLSFKIKDIYSKEDISAPGKKQDVQKELLDLLSRSSIVASVFNVIEKTKKSNIHDEKLNKFIHMLNSPAYRGALNTEMKKFAELDNVFGTNYFTIFKLIREGKSLDFDGNIEQYIKLQNEKMSRTIDSLIAKKFAIVDRITARMEDENYFKSPQYSADQNEFFDLLMILTRAENRSEIYKDSSLKNHGAITEGVSPIETSVLAELKISINNFWDLAEKINDYKKEIENVKNPVKKAVMQRELEKYNKSQSLAADNLIKIYGPNVSALVGMWNIVKFNDKGLIEHFVRPYLKQREQMEETVVEPEVDEKIKSEQQNQEVLQKGPIENETVKKTAGEPEVKVSIKKEVSKDVERIAAQFESVQFKIQKYLSAGGKLENIMRLPEILTKEELDEYLERRASTYLEKTQEELLDLLIYLEGYGFDKVQLVDGLMKADKEQFQAYAMELIEKHEMVDKKIAETKNKINFELNNEELVSNISDLSGAIYARRKIADIFELPVEEIEDVELNTKDNLAVKIKEIMRTPERTLFIPEALQLFGMINPEKNAFHGYDSCGYGENEYANLLAAQLREKVKSMDENIQELEEKENVEELTKAKEEKEKFFRLVDAYFDYDLNTPVQNEVKEEKPKKKLGDSIKGIFGSIFGRKKAATQSKNTVQEPTPQVQNETPVEQPAPQVEEKVPEEQPEQQVEEETPVVESTPQVEEATPAAEVDQQEQVNIEKFKQLAAKYAKVVRKEFGSDKEMVEFFQKEKQVFDPIEMKSKPNVEFQNNILIVHLLDNKEKMDKIKSVVDNSDLNFEDEIEMAKYFFFKIREKITKDPSEFLEWEQKQLDDLLDVALEEVRNQKELKEPEVEQQQEEILEEEKVDEEKIEKQSEEVVEQEVEDEKTITEQEEIKAEEQQEEILEEEPIKEENIVKQEEKVVEQEVIEKSVQETEIKKEAKVKKSRKMQGLYDDVPEEVRAGYDEMMKKSFTRELNKLTNEEVAYLHALFKDWCKEIDVNNMDADDARVFAIYTKIDNRYKKLVKLSEQAIEAATEEESIRKANEEIVKKI